MQTKRLRALRSLFGQIHHIFTLQLSNVAGVRGGGKRRPMANLTSAPVPCRGFSLLRTIENMAQSVRGYSLPVRPLKSIFIRAIAFVIAAGSWRWPGSKYPALISLAIVSLATDRSGSCLLIFKSSTHLSHGIKQQSTKLRCESSEASGSSTQPHPSFGLWAPHGHFAPVIRSGRGFSFDTRQAFGLNS
jgi:hypothetical protein